MMMGMIGPSIAGPTTPPTVAFAGQSSFPTGSGTTTRTWVAATLGTAFSTRRCFAMVRALTGGVTVSTTASDHTINGVACDRVDQVGTGNSLVAVVSAVVPTGTTGDVAIKTSGAETNTVRLEVYTCDNSQMSSSIPTVGSNSGTTTTNTATVATSANGFIILGWCGFAAGGVSPSITSSTAAMTTDANQTGLLAAHVNSVAANASWSATVSWTTNSTGDQLLLLAYR